MEKNLKDYFEKSLEASNFFKIFADDTRLKILLTINEKEISVGDIVKSVGISQSAVSHQLKILRDHRIVKTKKVGKSVFYSLDDNHIIAIIKDGFEHINE